MGKFISNLRELSGALGDLGTFVPIFIALVAINGLNPAVVLIISGIAYIACGFYYKIPVPVQPLKAMAAIAITLGLGKEYIQAAGLLIGLVLLIFSLFDLTKFLGKIFTGPIVKGMQLGVGLMLIKTSVIMLLKANSQQYAVSLPVLNFLDIPRIDFFLPSLDVFVKAFWILVLPQLPLTLGNAIVGTCDISKRYFGSRAKRVDERSLCCDLGITNLLAGFISGSLPLCHGSSGLTAHISFGARSGKATIITGILFLLCGCIFGKQAEAVFKMIPYGILGFMLFYVGFRHALRITDLRGEKGLFLALGIGIIGLFTDNLSFALCLGIFVWHLIQFFSRFFKISPCIEK